MWTGGEATEMRDIHFTGGMLPHRALIRVAGPDAQHFLHTVVTADIDHLVPGQATYAALLTPQGKVIADFFVLRTAEDFLIDCARSQRADLLRRLGLYKLRAKVEIGPDDGLSVGVSPAEPATALRYIDPRSPAIGWRFAAKPELAETPDYEEARIALGLPDTDADLGSAEFFPHEANLDQLGGLSFKKGCYVGQEVVSRMEHRALARSRILPVDIAGRAPAKGSEIRSGIKLVGTLLSSAGSKALAFIRLDRLEETAEPLLTDAVSVTVLKPRWARYDVPQAGGEA
jgi:hypothetical protein